MEKYELKHFDFFSVILLKNNPKRNGSPPQMLQIVNTFPLGTVFFINIDRKLFYALLERKLQNTSLHTAIFSIWQTNKK